MPAGAQLLSCHICRTHVSDDGQNGHGVEDLQPRADVSGLGRNRASELSGKLPGVHPDLQDVVEQSQQGGQGERGHEEGDEAKLHHWKERRQQCWHGRQATALHPDRLTLLTHLQVLVEEPQLTEVLEDVVLLPAAVMVLRVVASLPPAPPVPHHSIERSGH